MYLNLILVKIWSARRARRGFVTLLHSFQPKSNKVNVLDWNVRNVVCLLGCEERSILARRPRPKFHAAVHGRTNVPMVTPNRSGRTGTFLHNEKKTCLSSSLVYSFFFFLSAVSRRWTSSTCRQLIAAWNNFSATCDTSVQFHWQFFKKNY